MNYYNIASNIESNFIQGNITLKYFQTDFNTL